MNAIMHRDYQSNAPIRLYQYEDRIEIMNPGGLYGNARPENFPTVNDYRNPVIAEAMKVMDYVNMFSRGVGRVQEVLRENGNAEAVFELDKITVFNVVVRENPEEAAMTTAAAVKKSAHTVEKTVEKTVEIILAHLSRNPQTTQRQLQAETGLTRRGVEWQLQQLKAAGRLNVLALTRVGTGRWLNEEEVLCQAARSEGGRGLSMAGEKVGAQGQVVKSKTRDEVNGGGEATATPPSSIFGFGILQTCDSLETR